jgi:hypothetical protein
LGTQDDILVIVPLDPDGHPMIPIVSQTISVGSSILTSGYQSINYFYFQYTPTALYWLHLNSLATSPEYEIKYLRLDAIGNPVDSKIETIEGFKTLTLAADPAGDTIWITSPVKIVDAFTSEERVVGFTPIQL